MAVQSKGNALTRNPVKGVLLRLVSRVHTLATSRHLGRQFSRLAGLSSNQGIPLLSFSLRLACLPAFISFVFNNRRAGT